MALNPNITVPMPTEGVSFKEHSNGRTYVSYNISSKRISKTYVKHQRKTIGIKDENTGMLIPNANYYELFKDVVESFYAPSSIRDYGNYYLLYRIARDVNLINLLKNVFPKTWNKILTCAMYITCEGNTMDYCEDWCEETYTIDNTYLSSPAISNLHKTISIEDRMKFFKEWTKHIPEHETIAYDSTSISTYGKNITAAEYGHNKDGESLPQINYGMFYGEKSRLPLFYDIYNGSLLDKDHFESMMKYANTFGIKKVIYVMDRGYFKQNNIKYLYDNQQPFIIGLSLSLKDVKNNLGSLRETIKKSENSLSVFGTYGITKEIILFGIPIRLNLYYNFQKAADEIELIDKKISILEDELRKKLTLEDDSRYKRYFDILINDDQTFTYQRNYEAIDEEKQNAGYFAIASSRLDYTADEILMIYRNKDRLEKVFDDLKNFVDSNRLKVHSDEAVSGKMFITFISLIMKSQIIKNMNKEINQDNMSTKKVLLELKKIKKTTIHDKDTLMQPLTKKQKDILIKFNITEEEIKESLFQMHI